MKCWLQLIFTAGLQVANIIAVWNVVNFKREKLIEKEEIVQPIKYSELYFTIIIYFENLFIEKVCRFFIYCKKIIILKKFIVLIIIKITSEILYLKTNMS